MTEPWRFGPLLVALLAALAWPAQAQQTIAVAQTSGQSLRFGTMVVAVSGTLVLNPQTGALSGSATVLRPPSFASSPGAAEFVVTCTSSSYPIRYTLALTNTTANTLIATGDVTAFTAYSSLGALDNERTVNNCTGYSETVKVGATLTLGSSPTPGNYTAPDSITLLATITSGP